MITSDKVQSVGIIANPASGRDIRRLVAEASVFPISEKCSMILRALEGLGAAGVKNVFMLPDRGGISERIRRVLKNKLGSSQNSWPRVTFLDMSLENGPVDTLVAARKMIAVGVRAFIVLGGDGTNRIVARVSGDVPITSLSTGTNNVFPDLREATIAGLATGLTISGKIPSEQATLRNKVLRVYANGTEDLALVDACVSRTLWVGSKAV